MQARRRRGPVLAVGLALVLTPAGAHASQVDLAAPAVAPAPAAASSVGVGDANVDGLPDVAVADASGRVTVLLNDGHGGLAASSSLSLAATPLAAVALRDATGEGYPDVVAADPAAGTLLVAPGVGDGTFEPARAYPAGVRPVALAFADVTRDGRPDAVVADAGGSAVLVLPAFEEGFAAPVATAVPFAPRALAQGDLDGDTLSDVVAVGRGVATLRGTAEGGLAAPARLLPKRRFRDVVVADVTGDGARDVVVVGPPANLRVLAGDGHGALAPLPRRRVAERPVALAVADLDSDDRPDLIAGSAAAATVSVLQATASGGYVRHDFPAGGGVLDLALADVDRDGRVDLLAADGPAGLALLRNVTPDVLPPTAPTGLRATAVDGGQFDLVWNTSTDDVGVTGYVLFRDGVRVAAPNPGATTFTDATAAPQTRSAYTLEARDVGGNPSPASNVATAATPAAVTAARPYGHGDDWRQWTADTHAAAPVEQAADGALTLRLPAGAFTAGDTAAFRLDVPANVKPSSITLSLGAALGSGVHAFVAQRTAITERWSGSPPAGPLTVALGANRSLWVGLRVDPGYAAAPGRVDSLTVSAYTVVGSEQRVDRQGFLHAVGRELRDDAGNLILLRGLVVATLLGGSGNTRDECGVRWSAVPQGAAAAIARLGFDSVRLPVSWANLEPTAPTVEADGTLTHHWNALYLAALDDAVASFRATGVGVVLDMHQSQWSPAFTHFTPSGGIDRGERCEGAGMPVWLYPDAVPGDTPVAARCEMFANQARAGVPVAPQDGLAAAWQELARRYAGNAGVVAFDLFNEPGWGATCRLPRSELDVFTERLGAAVRSVNADAVAIYEDGTWISYLQSGFFLTRPPQIANSAYDWHYYPDDYTTVPYDAGGAPLPTGAEQLAAHTWRTRDWGVPFWIGEFNAFNQGYNHEEAHTDPAWQEDLAALMQYSLDRQLGWNFWAYGGDQGSTLLDPHTGRPKPDLLAGLQAGL